MMLNLANTTNKPNHQFLFLVLAKLNRYTDYCIWSLCSSSQSNLGKIISSSTDRIQGRAKYEKTRNSLTEKEKTSYKWSLLMLSNRVNNLSRSHSLTNLCSAARLAAQAQWHITISAKATKCKKGRKYQRAVTRPAVNQSLFPVWVANEGRENREGEKRDRWLEVVRWQRDRICKTEWKTASVKGEMHHAFQTQAYTHAWLGKQRVNKNTWKRKTKYL